MRQQLGLGLLQQAVARVVLFEHFPKQTGRGLQLSAAAPFARVALKNQPCHAGDFPKTPLRQFARVQAVQHLLQQSAVVGRLGQQLGQQCSPINRGGAQQLQPIVVHRHRERGWCALRHAPRDQAGQAQMHMAPGKGVEKQVVALARAQQLGQQGAGRGQGRPAGLQRQHGSRGLQLGRAPVAGLCAGQLGHHGVGQRGRQWHLAPVPARHGGLAAAGAPHPGRHLMDAHQLQLPPAEQETVAGLEPRGKTLFHMADLAAAQVLHHHARVAHDGANVHAVAPRQPRVGHAPHAVFVGHHATVVGVRGERGAALTHKVQTPLPSVVGQVGVSGGAADFGQQCVGHKATAQGHGHQVLHQHIQRLLWRVARFDVARLHRRARRHAFDDF